MENEVNGTSLMEQVNVVLETKQAIDSHTYTTTLVVTILLTQQVRAELMKYAEHAPTFPCVVVGMADQVNLFIVYNVPTFEHDLVIFVTLCAVLGRRQQPSFISTTIINFQPRSISSSARSRSV